MAHKERVREDEAFARGDIGVDGLAVEEEKDEAELDRDKAKTELTRNRTYLGRELLTWLLCQSASGDPIIQHKDEPVTVLFVGRIVLRGIAGDTTEIVAKGALAPYADIVRMAMARGLLVHSGRIRLQRGEQTFFVTLDAEHLDFRSADVPAVLSEEEDDKIAERLFLAEELSGMIDAILERFLDVRTSPKWKKTVVPELRAWLADA